MKNYAEIMRTQEPYVCMYDQVPVEHQKVAKRLLKKYEAIDEDDRESQVRVLSELLGTSNPEVFIGEGFRCDYGYNIHFHGMAVLNYNVVMLDTSPIHIGAGALIAPGVCLTCAGHAIDPVQRMAGVNTSKPITLEDGVWIGANATICGGVTIGKGSIIGAGSVVTKDIPAGVVAVGNPCRVLREITDADIEELENPSVRVD